MNNEYNAKYTTYINVLKDTNPSTSGWFKIFALYFLYVLYYNS